MLNQPSTREVVVLCSRIPDATPALAQMVSDVLTRHGAIAFEAATGKWLGVFNLPHELPVAHYLSLLSAVEIVRSAGDLGNHTAAIGIDCGSVQFEGSQPDRLSISGEVMSNAQRLADEAEAGSLLISQQVYNEIQMVSRDFEVLKVVMPERSGDQQNRYRLRPDRKSVV